MSQSKFIVPVADRVANLPPYVFATVFQMKEKALQAGREVIERDGPFPGAILSHRPGSLCQIPLPIGRRLCAARRS